jgi:hypothetical protein
MKTTKIFSTAILCLILSVTLVAATNSAITMTPSGWAKGTSQSVSLTVTNNGQDNIVSIELVVPQDSNHVPLYNVDPQQIMTPQGWNSATVGNPASRVKWVALGSGLASGSSLNLFGLSAISPSTSGNYLWSWMTTDSKNVIFTGSITTNVGQAPVAYFAISSVPTTSVAGKSFNINVKAYGADNNIKTDYTGTISFGSVDVNAVLPFSYTFLSSDGGSKNFAITYKTSGADSFTVTDSTSGISKESIKTTVNPGTAVDIGINPTNKAVSIGESVTFTVLAKDGFGNLFDVTGKSKLTIENGAGGSWNKNVYKTQNQGTWGVSASYNSFVSVTKVIVGQVQVTNVTVTQPINVTTTVPGEVTEVTLSVPDTITILPGANDTMIATVNNNGNSDLTNVRIGVEGVPSDWVSVYPVSNDVPAKSSKDYLVMVIVPSNESGSKTLTFVTTSDQKVTASKETNLVISSTPTGTFALPKNVLQLGVVVIAVAAVVIIGWELWFKKPKSK